jgi:surfactin synthase thioesterase subunit
LLVPVLQADLRLIEGYTYVPGAPLDCPIFAYAGASDPHAPESELAAWSRETTARVRVRQFPGGHFYLQAGRDSLLSALREDCGTLPVSGVPVPVKVLER